MIKSGKNSAFVNTVYRFKIWTRKSYSVFNSLGKQISIGFLSIDLSGKIGAKSGSSPQDLTLWVGAALQDEVIPEEEKPIGASGIFREGLIALVLFLLGSAAQNHECCSGAKSQKLSFQNRQLFYCYQFFLSYPSAFLRSFHLIIAYFTKPNSLNRSLHPNQRNLAFYNRCPESRAHNAWFFFLWRLFSGMNYLLINNKPQFFYLNQTIYCYET